MTKRNFTTICNDITVGGLMATGSLRTVESIHDSCSKLTLNYETNLGRIGSAVVEYGFPALAGLAFVSLTYRVVKAFDNYLLKEQGK